MCNAASGLWPLDLIGFCLKFLEHPGLLKPGYLLHIGLHGFVIYNSRVVL